MSTAFWTMTDANTGVPIFTPSALKLEPTRANANVIFANSNTAQAFSAAVGVFGVDTQEATNTQVTPAATKMAHAGWVQRTAGMGGVISITANTNSYGENSFVTFSGGGTGATDANASVAVDSNGRIVAVTVNTPGLYLTTPDATSPNSNAAYTITMGGRANRTQYETIVATGSITGNGAVII